MARNGEEEHGAVSKYGQVAEGKLVNERVPGRHEAQGFRNGERISLLQASE